MSGFQTPDSLEAGTRRRIVALPADQALWEAITGALYSLTIVENWEKDGDATPEETAQFFEEWLADYLDSLEDIPE